MKINNITKYLLIVIVLLAFFLRVYQVDAIPPAISWDEAAVGVNAYSMASYAHDEWGKFLPLVFKSFEDDKNPVHIYSTAVFVKILGLSNLSVRLPAVFFGTLNVLLIFFLGRKLFNSKWVGLTAAFFLSISPYALQFSRFNHEANFALFFFMLGLILFYRGLEKRNFLLSLSLLSFGTSLLSYHSAKAVVPPILLLLFLFYFKKLLKVKNYFILGLFFLGLIGLVFILNPALSGAARIQQTAIPQNIIYQTDFYKLTKNETLGWLQVFGNRYLTHFSETYLFISGDRIARHSIQTVGEFYKIDAIFLLLGLLLIIKQRKKEYFLLLAWALLAPIPAAASGGSGEVPHAARAMFMMGSWHLVAAGGFIFGFSLLRKKQFQIIVSCLLILTLGFEFKSYLGNYYGTYSAKYATEWQYGMKQIVEYVHDHKNYSQVYMTDERHQPYIFFLYYLKTPLPDYLNSVQYNDSISRSYNLVLGFEKYYFGTWDPIESMPNGGVLYIVTPSQYDGLRYKSAFDIKKIVKYPNGENAFFLVSAF
ncbi:MAG: glycosyltransferase family 39 protein [Candidatus Daviesbacteria bacterium]|nr:glycosyltransferase family 39 protein [Candidatus Daviesbacteria bacterium]